MQSTPMLTFLFITCVWHKHARADFEHRCTLENYFERRSVATRCGAGLSETIKSLCKNGINMGKRSFVPGVLPGSNSQNSLPAYGQQFRTANQANSFLTPNKRPAHRSQVGIVCECCLNRCTNREMLQYCASPNTKRAEAGESNKRSEDDKEDWLEEIMEVLHDPEVQKLEQQKIINIQLGNPGKRMSGEAKGKGATQRPFEKGYIVDSLLQMLAKQTQSNATASNTQNHRAEDVAEAWAKLRQDLNIPPQ